MVILGKDYRGIRAGRGVTFRRGPRADPGKWTGGSVGKRVGDARRGERRAGDTRAGNSRGERADVAIRRVLLGTATIVNGVREGTSARASDVFARVLGDLLVW